MKITGNKDCKYLSELVPGVRANVVVTMIMELPALSESMIQRGVIADDTGMLIFVDWFPKTHEPLAVGKTYFIQSMKTTAFRGQVNCNLVYAKVEETMSMGLDVAKIKKTVPLQWTKDHKRRKNGPAFKCKE